MRSNWMKLVFSFAAFGSIIGSSALSTGPNRGPSSKKQKQNGTRNKMAAAVPTSAPSAATATGSKPIQLTSSNSTRRSSSKKKTKSKNLSKDPTQGDDEQYYKVVGKEASALKQVLTGVNEEKSNAIAKNQEWLSNWMWIKEVTLTFTAISVAFSLVFTMLDLQLPHFWETDDSRVDWLTLNVVLGTSLVFYAHCQECYHSEAHIVMEGFYQQNKRNAELIKQNKNPIQSVGETEEMMCEKIMTFYSTAFMFFICCTHVFLNIGVEHILGVTLSASLLEFEKRLFCLAIAVKVLDKNIIQTFLAVFAMYLTTQF